MKVLVTGAAGFIGFHVTAALLARGDQVIGFDNLNDYYEPGLKEARLALLTGRDGFEMVRSDLTDVLAIEATFDKGPDRVVHLAAQPGVRYSITNPRAYIDANIVGTLNILEGCRNRGTEHLVYASSSSVYGANTRMPSSVHDSAEHPVSLYAATKKATELMAHAYSHLYNIPTTGLRFFTVYGPWGRPDMAPALFTHAVLTGQPIKVFNKGTLQRDFTYIDDIVEGVLRVIDMVATPNPDWSGQLPDPATSTAPFRLYNIGNNSPVELLAFIEEIERATGHPAKLDLLPMQPGDVLSTSADVDDLHKAIGFAPTTPLEVGIRRFVKWYRSYYKL